MYSRSHWQTSLSIFRAGKFITPNSNCKVLLCTSILILDRLEKKKILSLYLGIESCLLSCHGLLLSTVETFRYLSSFFSLKQTLSLYGKKLTINKKAFWTFWATQILAKVNESFPSFPSYFLFVYKIQLIFIEPLADFFHQQIIRYASGLSWLIHLFITFVNVSLIIQFKAITNDL